MTHYNAHSHGTARGQLKDCAFELKCKHLSFELVHHPWETSNQVSVQLVSNQRVEACL